MSKSLFVHIKQITNVQNPMYWESLDDGGEKDTWSNYVVHRFLSMKSEWLVVVNEDTKSIAELGLEMYISFILMCYQRVELF